MFKIKFWPITASPISAMSACGSICRVGLNPGKDDTTARLARQQFFIKTQIRHHRWATWQSHGQLYCQSIMANVGEVKMNCALMRTTESGKLVQL
jgi:hypothetical protein